MVDGDQLAADLVADRPRPSNEVGNRPPSTTPEATRSRLAVSETEWRALAGVFDESIEAIEAGVLAHVGRKYIVSLAVARFVDRASMPSSPKAQKSRAEWQDALFHDIKNEWALPMTKPEFYEALADLGQAVVPESKARVKQRIRREEARRKKLSGS
jgi:hypothetical protein